MDVKSLCKTDVLTARAFEEIGTAAKRMRDRHVGYLIIAEPLPLGGWSKPVGILTDRDIVVEVLAKDVDPRSVTVGDVMTRDPVVVDEQDSLSHALRAMRRVGARRLPVVGSAGQLTGVISMDDILSHLAGTLSELSGSVQHELDVEKSLRA